MIRAYYLTQNSDFCHAIFLALSKNFLLSFTHKQTAKLRGQTI